MPYFKAGRFSLGIASRLAKKAFEWADELFGMAFLKELNEFFMAFEGLYAGFRERAERVSELMQRGDLNAFIVVTSPARDTVSEARYFLDQLREFGMPVGGVIANRVHPLFGGPGGIEGPLGMAIESEAGARALEARVREAFAGEPVVARAVEKALENFCEFEALARADRKHLEPLLAAVRATGHFAKEIPAFERDVYDMAGLARLASLLLREGVASPAA
jgi:hypothetical protein